MLDSIRDIDKALKQKIADKILSKFEVVLTTCASSYSYILRKETFKYVLIDEICQCLEPESLLPLTKGANTWCSSETNGSWDPL